MNISTLVARRRQQRSLLIALAIILILPLCRFLPPPSAHAAAPNKLGVNLAGFYDTPYLQAVVAAVGDGGYVGIVVSPEQGYRLPKFLLDCYSLHLIPVLRLAATQGAGQAWPQPQTSDALVWANILNNLDWHGLPRIIEVGNEMNLNSEWGGHADPAGYTDYLITVARTLKATSAPGSYRILMGALTLGAPDLPGTAIAPATFVTQMKQHIPTVFDYVDGTAANIYTVRPYPDNRRWNFFGYQEQLDLMGRNMPVYIMEEGLDPHFPYTDQDAADHLRLAWPDWQADPNVMTSMPLAYVPGQYLPDGFGSDGFWMFRLDPNGSLAAVSRTYNQMVEIAKSPDRLPTLSDQDRMIRSFLPSPPQGKAGDLYFPEVKRHLNSHFVAAWQQGDGLAMFGYPLHEAALVGGNLVQYTERARFEWHPAAGQSCCDGSGSLMFGLLGQEAITLHNLSFPSALPDNDSVMWNSATATPTATPAPKKVGKSLTAAPTITPTMPAPVVIYFRESRHNLSGKLLDYWQTHGGVSTFGYPLSEPFTDQSGITVQYFERARFELHPEGVLLGRLGYEIARSLDYKGYW